MTDRRQRPLRGVVGIVAALCLAAPLAAGAQPAAQAAPPAKAAASAPVPATAAQPDVDLDEVLHDTQKSSGNPDRITMAWWLPGDYWRAVLQKGGQLSAEQLDSIIAALQPYTLVIVVDGKLGPLGGITYKPEEDLRKETRLVDLAGTAYEPLSTDQVNADTRNFLNMMKPVLANMMGALGENLHFFVFPAKDKAGKAIAEPKSDGKMTVRVADESFVFRLPLGSLIPRKMCPQDKEILSGAWTYCPWHGVKLVAVQK